MGVALMGSAGNEGVGGSIIVFFLKANCRCSDGKAGGGGCRFFPHPSRTTSPTNSWNVTNEALSTIARIRTRPEDISVPLTFGQERTRPVPSPWGVFFNPARRGRHGFSPPRDGLVHPILSSAVNLITYRLGRHAPAHPIGFLINAAGCLVPPKAVVRGSRLTSFFSFSERNAPFFCPY